MSGDVYVKFQADTGELEGAFALARAQTQAWQREMAATAREITRTGATMDSELGRHLNAVSASFAAGQREMAELRAEMHGVAAGQGEIASVFATLSERVTGVLSPLTDLRANLRETAEAVAAAFAIEKIAEFAELMAELGLETKKASEVLGVSTEQIGALSLIANASGSSLDQLEMQFTRLSRGIAEQSAGTKRALDALQLKFSDLTGKDAIGTLETLAGAFQKIRDGSDKDAIGVELVGRSFKDLLPLLDEGPEAFERWRKAAEETGSALSETTVRGMEETHGELTTLAGAIKGDGVAAFVNFNTVINGAVQIAKDWAEELQHGASAGGELSIALRLAAASVAVFESALAVTIGTFLQLGITAETSLNAINQDFEGVGKEAGDVFRDLGAGIGGFFSGLVSAGEETAKSVGRQFVDLGQAISDGLHGDIAGAKAALEAINDDSKATGDKIMKSLSGSFDFSNVAADAKENAAKLEVIWRDGNARVEELNKKMKSEMDAIWGVPLAATGGSGAVTQRDAHMAPAERGGRGGADDADAAREAFQNQVDEARRAAQATIDSLNEEVKAHKISWDTWAADSRAALQEEAAAITAAGVAAVNSDALTADQKLKIARETADKIAEIDKEEAADATKAAEETQRAWDSFFKPFNSAIESQISAVVSGHETMREAVTKTLDSMLADVLKYFTTWALKQAELVAAHIAGNQLMHASDAAGNLFDLSQLIANAARTISVDAGVTAAGVTANQAPLVGPLALGEGLAAGSSVAALASFDIGAWSIPQDMLSVVHHGELVMPAGEASAFRDMLSGRAQGGADSGAGRAVHIHFNPNVSAIDSRGVNDFLKSYEPEIARTVARHFDKNPSARSRY